LRKSKALVTRPPSTQHQLRDPVGDTITPANGVDLRVMDAAGSPQERHSGFAAKGHVFQIAIGALSSHMAGGQATKRPTWGFGAPSGTRTPNPLKLAARLLLLCRSRDIASDLCVCLSTEPGVTSPSGGFALMVA
jgi:hypothetical protein